MVSEQEDFNNFLTPEAAVALIEKQLVELPGGEIELRDDRLQQKWRVAIAPFLLSRYLVTQELYAAITHAKPSSFKGAQKPVESFSWREAALFCNLLSGYAGFENYYVPGAQKEDFGFNPMADGYRLPTEAEWEYACKAGTTASRYGELDAIAWYKANAGNTTHEVGLKAPNAWGLYDMLGNVWEWCSDIYDETVYGSYRIIRGGGWCDEARGCLATNRRRSHSVSFKIDDLGFRVARNLPGK